uniref:Phosphatidylinositide phosphatase SAC1like protein putative n=1 Tax=Albugo laibachii Nc14 TaxID=890382 RepID=F0VZX1_9STRA|nr:phosphatidylinositide phosphatase SAC1like protein putative [Albugo laibachii Nc14]|eukprot:CCA14342.1 phosphatidylinositide phosphatase SAC1like protein putative [Albugo laibachii Nc14]
MKSSCNRAKRAHRFRLLLQDDIIIIQRASFSECLAIPRSAIASVKGPTSTKGDPVRPTLNIAVEDLKTFSPLHGRILGFDAIYGIIWLLRGPYLALVSDSKVISNNEIHKEIRQVMKLELLLIATYQNEAPLTPEQERDESRYLEMLTTNIDKLQLHFSFDSDLTHSLQRSSELKPFASSASHDDNYAAIAERADRRFCWNYIHCAAFFEKKLYKWITPLMQGFIEVTETIRVNRTAFKMIFISRRSCRRPGTRFTMRGIDENGNVANFVETEQICVFQDGRQTSFLQIRGSIPFHWSSPVNMKYAPPVYQRNRIEKDVEAFRKHAYELMQLYGRVILINLIDKKRHELQLGNALTKVIGTAANQDSHILATIRLVWFDFHQECRKMRYQNLVRLIQLVDDDFRNYGFFCRDADGSVTQTQSGVVRTNCMDNLDRTNVVQSLFGRRSLLIQLNEMEALQGDVLNTAFHDFESVFKRIWGNHADAISRLYAGTGALKTDFTRTGRRTKLGVIMDAYNSSLRYILNNFMDGYRQDVLDLLLGKYLVFRNAPSPFTSSQETAESVLKRVLSLTAVIFLYETTTSSAPLAALFEHLGKAIVWTALICSIYLFILMKKGHKHGERLVRLPRLRPRDGCTTHWKD